MLWIQLDGLGVVCNGRLKVALLAIGESTIVIEVSLSWLDIDG